ncbi:MAG TPA: peptidylprolyl isomerase [Terriglobales bacterium]|jgi:parvulin-like peptidyl-prolyl isomerase
MSFSSLPRVSRVIVAAAVLLGCGSGLLAQTPSQTGSSATPAAMGAAASDPVVISAGGAQLHASEFQALLMSSPAQNQAEMEANKRAVADELAKMLALVDAAQRQGLDQDAAFKAEMLLTRDNALAKALVDKLQAAATPTDAQIQAYYDAHTSDYVQTKVRHILVGDAETPGGPNPRTQAAALAKVQQLETQLKNGADFAALAKTDSDDPGSKAQGGELGVIAPGQTVPEFETAVKALPVGKISDPIHTRFGYHIVEVESRAPQPLPQVKAQIVEALSTPVVEAQIDKITAAAHPVISDSYFGPEPAAAPAGSAPPAAPAAPATPKQ